MTGSDISRHLLGKKSWNVYNQDNIDRVRRDEAKAQAAEKEAERKKRDDEASERLRILRGGQPEEDGTEISARSEKKRKRNEDDGEPSHSYGEERRPKLSSRNGSSRDESRDAQGNLLEANVTHEKLDSISNMRFRDAVGRHNGSQNPWYSTASSADPGPGVGRDVWGNEDAGRQARDQKRLNAGDPLLAIKRGVKQLKNVENQKAEWRKERERDLYEVEDLARRERHRRRREERHKHDKDKDRDSDRHKHRSRKDGDDRKRSRSRDKTRSREERGRYDCF